MPIIAALWRHPVKSLQGESLAAATIDHDGLRGDRRWGIRDEATGRILTGRREPRLLLASASLPDDGDGSEPVIALPDGEQCAGLSAATDAALTEWLGKPVTLVDATKTVAGHAEFFSDATDDTSTPIEWTMPEGRFVDALPLLVLTTASLRAGGQLHPDGVWDARRFRPNIVIDVDGDTWVEDDWLGATMRAGDVEIVLRAPCVRCTMVIRPQPGLERDVDIYKTVARHHAGTFGLWSSVTTPGSLRVGEPVTVHDETRRGPR